MSQKIHSFIEEPLPYELEELQKWQNNDDSCINILINSKAPLPIKRSIGYKKGFIIDENGNFLSRRNDKPNPRETMHFDVAKAVINNLENVKFGWYGSYDWLKKPYWTIPYYFLPKRKDDYSKEFKNVYQKALIEHIGISSLKQLQEDVKKLPCVAEPDLWLIKDDGTFLFVEAKLDKKSVSDSQIAGLALLKKSLGAEVKIIRLHQKWNNVELLNHTEKFNFYYDLL